MSGFDLITSTVRGGVAVDEVEIPVDGGVAATGYLIGELHDSPQPLVIGLHDARGDKATLLPDLELLARRGFRCLSIDSPVTRRASAGRNPWQAFAQQLAITETSLAIAADDPSIYNGRIALLGRGIGAEVAAAAAAGTDMVRVVVGMAPLPDRSGFVQLSQHPLAAGIRQFNSGEDALQQISSLAAHRLVDYLDTATKTHWLLQVAEDDDRLDPSDFALLAQSIPPTVRVDYAASRADLMSHEARQRRVAFICKLCG